MSRTDKNKIVRRNRDSKQPGTQNLSVIIMLIVISFSLPIVAVAGLFAFGVHLLLRDFNN